MVDRAVLNNTLSAYIITGGRVLKQGFPFLIALAFSAFAVARTVSALMERCESHFKGFPAASLSLFMIAFRTFRDDEGFRHQCDAAACADESARRPCAVAQVPPAEAPALAATELVAAAVVAGASPPAPDVAEDPPKRSDGEASPLAPDVAEAPPKHSDGWLDGDNAEAPPGQKQAPAEATPDEESQPASDAAEGASKQADGWLDDDWPTNDARAPPFEELALAATALVAASVIAEALPPAPAAAEDPAKQADS